MLTWRFLYGLHVALTWVDGSHRWSCLEFHCIKSLPKFCFHIFGNVSTSPVYMSHPHPTLISPGSFPLHYKPTQLAFTVSNNKDLFWSHHSPTPPWLRSQGSCLLPTTSSALRLLPPNKIHLSLWIAGQRSYPWRKHPRRPVVIKFLWHALNSRASQN